MRKLLCKSFLLFTLMGASKHAWAHHYFSPNFSNMAGVSIDGSGEPQRHISLLADCMLYRPFENKGQPLLEYGFRSGVEQVFDDLGMQSARISADLRSAWVYGSFDCAENSLAVYVGGFRGLIPPTTTNNSLNQYYSGMRASLAWESNPSFYVTGAGFELTAEIPDMAAGSSTIRWIFSVKRPDLLVVEFFWWVNSPSEHDQNNGYGCPWRCRS